jgi:hypothetical protein
MAAKIFTINTIDTPTAAQVTDSTTTGILFLGNFLENGSGVVVEISQNGTNYGVLTYDINFNAKQPGTYPAYYMSSIPAGWSVRCKAVGTFAGQPNVTVVIE